MGGVGGVLEGDNLQHDLLVCQPYNEVEEELANTGNADEFDEYEYEEEYRVRKKYDDDDEYIGSADEYTLIAPIRKMSMHAHERVRI